MARNGSAGHTAEEGNYSSLFPSETSVPVVLALEILFFFSD